MCAWGFRVCRGVSGGFFLRFFVLGFNASPLLLSGFARVVVFDLLVFGGDTGPNGEAEVDKEYAEDSAGAGEGGFGLGAVMHILGVEADGAGFGDVPGWAVLRVFWVGGVG